MKNKALKTLLISIALFFSVSFINVDKASAASCYCYYRSPSTVQAYSGNMTQTVFYLYKVKYTRNHITVTERCSFAYFNQTTQDINDSTGNTERHCIQSPSDAFDGSFDQSKVDKANKITNDCSKASCFDKNMSTGRTAPNGELSNYVSDNLVLTPIDEDEYNRTEDYYDVGSPDATIDEIKQASDKQLAVPGATATNCDLIPQSVKDMLSFLFKLIQIIAVVLFVVLSMIEFMKAVANKDDYALKGAFKNLARRTVIVVMLLLVEVFVTWIINFINENRYETKIIANGTKKQVTYIIGSDGNPICK